MYIDRRFLQKFMPTFEGYLHYQQIDVSSIKLLSQAWYGSKVALRKELVRIRR